MRRLILLVVALSAAFAFAPRPDAAWGQPSVEQRAAELRAQCASELDAYKANKINSVITAAQIERQQRDYSVSLASRDQATFEQMYANWTRGIQTTNRPNPNSRDQMLDYGVNRCLMDARAAQGRGALASAPPAGPLAQTGAPEGPPDFGGSTCTDALARQNAGFDATVAPTDTTLRYRYLLAYFEGRIGILESKCQGNDGFAEGRAQLTTQRDAVLAQCRGISSSPDQCVAAMPNAPPRAASYAPPP